MQRLDNLPSRRSVRLGDFDYSNPGHYFITICTKGKRSLFGEIVSERVHLSKAGNIARDELLVSGEIRSEIELDGWVIMPNHVHAIVIINDVGMRGTRPHAMQETTNEGACPAPLQMKPRSLSSFVNGFKSAVTSRLRKMTGNSNLSIWQRNYYEHVIRNDKELNAVRQYIIENPSRWHSDCENPSTINDCVGARGTRPSS